MSFFLSSWQQKCCSECLEPTTNYQPDALRRELSTSMFPALPPTIFPTHRLLVYLYLRLPWHRPCHLKEIRKAVAAHCSTSYSYKVGVLLENFLHARNGRKQSTCRTRTKCSSLLNTIFILQFGRHKKRPPRTLCTICGHSYAHLDALFGCVTQKRWPRYICITQIRLGPECRVHDSTAKNEMLLQRRMSFSPRSTAGLGCMNPMAR